MGSCRYYNSRVDLGVIEIMGYSMIPKTTELEPHHQMFNNILWTPFLEKNIFLSDSSYNMNIKTNMGGIFPKLVHKHFTEILHKLFNTNNLKVTLVLTAVRRLFINIKKKS